MDHNDDGETLFDTSLTTLLSNLHTYSQAVPTAAGRNVVTPVCF